ncbi:MAG TPA: FecR family protein [Allosphingosinicella sp.]|jgi:hypothetical protein
MSFRLSTAAGHGLAAAALIGLAASPVLAQPNAVGVEAAVRGDVKIRAAAGGKVRPGVVRERVILNDEVRTGGASQLQILLLDRSTFTVGANARVAIDRFVYDPAANSRAVGVSVTRGAFRFMSGRALGHPSGSASVRTPVASIGIRGTIFEGVVGEDAVRIAEREAAVGKHVKADKDEASLIVLRGPGPRTQGDTVPGAIDVSAGGRTVTLDGPDLALYAPRAGVPPIGPFQISPAGLAALQSLLRPAPSGGGGGGSHTTRNVLIGVGAVAAGVLGAKLLGGKKKRPNIPDKPNPNPPGKQ